MKIYASNFSLLRKLIDCYTRFADHKQIWRDIVSARNELNFLGELAPGVSGTERRLKTYRVARR